MSTIISIFAVVMAAIYVDVGDAFLSFRKRPTRMARKSRLAATYGPKRTINKQRNTSVDRFVDAWNRRDVSEAIEQFADDAFLDDTACPGAFVGKTEIKRHLLLSKDALPEEQSPLMTVDTSAVSSCGTKVGIKWHEIDPKSNEKIPNRRGCAFYNLHPDTGLIERGFQVMEPTIKSGKASLAVLSAAGKFIEKTGINSLPQDPNGVAKGNQEQTSEIATNQDEKLFGNEKGAIAKSQTTAAERYFEAWNNRNMESATALFASDCKYEDTVFPEPFSGQETLRKHLNTCADSFPTTFKFVVDDVAQDVSSRICVRWHVENNGEQLPFTRGCSFYVTDERTMLINEGIDFIEPQVKLGGVKLALQSTVTKLKQEPVRLIPLVVWVAYMYIVFLSHGILPGANALQLEQRTWEEVRDLSLNFFLVAPLLQLPFSPVVHPMLEGVFNLLLSWAALFACFLSDEREEKPNALPMLPMIAGMQFLTSAFLLPYLVTRTSEKLPDNEKENHAVYIEDLDAAGRIAGESRILGPLLGSVGLGSIVWGFAGRLSDFGEVHDRYSSFVDLLSIDRVGSSFLVDLAIFALFQGWLVEDDMRRRRSVLEDDVGLRSIAIYVPFFGLAAYSFFRPPLPSKSEDTT